MIPVRRPKVPRTFGEQVARPGNRWLAEHPTGDPPAHWRKATADLAAAFSDRCGYSAMLDRNGTVDHFVPGHRDRSKLYEWDNLRYASHWINASKGDRDGVLDPYETGEGWFEVLLPSLQLVMTDRVPVRKRALVQGTLEKLPISHDERVVRQRRAWLEQYEKGLIGLEALRVYAPLIAAAIEKRDAKPGGVTAAPRRRAGGGAPAGGRSKRRPVKR